MIQIGATAVSLTGWGANSGHLKDSRGRRLAAVRRLVEQYGLSAVELSLDLDLIHPQAFGSGFYLTVADLQQELGFTCTVHLPFLWLDLASLNEPLRQAGVHCVRRAIELAQPVEVAAYVLHLWGATTADIIGLPVDPAQREKILGKAMAQARCSLARVCQFLENQKLCIETLRTPSFEIVLPLIEEFETSICLDTGYLTHAGGSAPDFLARHGARVREVHLYDTARVATGEQSLTCDRLPLGKGQMDYVSLLHHLDEIGFDGPVILEHNSQADLEESLAQLRSFL